MATLPERIERVVRDLAGRVRSRHGDRVRDVRLYGSYARGDAHEGSDVDVFVRIQGITEAERRELFDLVGDVDVEHLVTVHVFAPSDEEYRWLDHHQARILRDIRAEGMAL
jgi:predicted nucleotidyltransferase